jgi:hypothetical protein
VVRERVRWLTLTVSLFEIFARIPIAIANEGSLASVQQRAQEQQIVLCPRLLDLAARANPVEGTVASAAPAARPSDPAGSAPDLAAVGPVPSVSSGIAGGLGMVQAPLGASVPAASVASAEPAVAPAVPNAPAAPAVLTAPSHSGTDTVAR